MAADSSASFFDRSGGSQQSRPRPLGEPATVNVMRFSNDQVSQLLDKIARSNDEAAIIEMFHEVQRIYVDQQPYVIYNESGSSIG